MTGEPTDSVNKDNVNPHFNMPSHPLFFGNNNPVNNTYIPADFVLNPPPVNVCPQCGHCPTCGKSNQPVYYAPHWTISSGTALPPVFR